VRLSGNFSHGDITNPALEKECLRSVENRLPFLLSSSLKATFVH
jgi:hypothetical protein